MFLIGLIGLITGIVLTPTPVPGTTLLIIVSVGLLIHSSSRAEKLIRALRHRYDALNRLFTKFEDLAHPKSKKVGETLKKTRPK